LRKRSLLATILTIAMAPSLWGQATPSCPTAATLPPDGPPMARGINSMQAEFDGSQWKFIQILWERETPEEPLSPKFLP